MRRQSCLAIVLSILCAGCGESNDANEVPEVGRETVFDPLTETLDRAQGVEDTLLQSADERRRQLEEAEQ